MLRWSIRVVLIAGIIFWVLPGKVPSQSLPDSLKVDNREFLRLLRRAEDLNKEQKQRAKRTINARVLTRLAQDEDPGVRFYVAFNPWTPAKVLVDLARDANQTVRWAVAMNTRVLFQVDPAFREYLDNGTLNLELETAFGARGAAPGREALIEIVEQGRRWRIAGVDRTYTLEHEDGVLTVFNTPTAREALQELAKDYVEIVRVGLASNGQTPPTILRNLAQDVSRVVQQKVAANRNTEPVILEILSRVQDPSIRLKVAQNPHTPLRVMERFSIVNDETFRVAVAQNPGTSPAILLGLIFDSSDSVRRAVAAHSSTPVPALLRLAEDVDLEVRKATVYNGNTPREALTQLSFDKDREIKEVARSRLAQLLKQQIDRDRER
ncbi:MAG: hypothetical protein O2954_14530 [bacterium]|nr:hypothetical protein [bacterium]